ncbi:GNAT family N-acetyltransferase [Pyrococcus kukulkanii]|uniref:N-acetyltransferase domain-containing protein n=1 Tax=Pyrococcus kukulkanii TaxID=1609559 RepID=A0A127B9R9_9EURY|nr:GNAT family N-acetyltransferase [Pyrococcus kukulkanii]AMM53967.1 hypothetical protein TQ32_05340 [Pyrococcus kukulkanii]
MIVRGDEIEIQDIVSFMNSCFRTYREWNLTVEKFKVWLESDEGIKQENMFFYLCDNKIAGMIQIVERFVKIGDSFKSCAGIANVCTKQEFRGRGIAKKLLEEVLNYAKENYEICALLAGYGELAHAIYRKYGFKDSYFTEYGIMLRDDLNSTSIECPYIRKANEKDVKGIVNLYNNYILLTGLSGVIKRNERYILEKFIKRTFWHTFFYSPEQGNVIVFDDGKLQGYASTLEGPRIGTVIVREIVGKDRDIVRDMLGYIFEKYNAKSLTIYAPPQELKLLNLETFRVPESYMFKDFHVKNAYIFYSDRW